VNGEPVGPARVLARDVAFAVGREAQNAPERNIDDVEIARAVERGAFEKRAEFRAGVIRV